MARGRVPKWKWHTRSLSLLVPSLNATEPRKARTQYGQSQHSLLPPVLSRLFPPLPLLSSPAVAAGHVQRSFSALCSQLDGLVNGLLEGAPDLSHPRRGADDRLRAAQG